MRRIFLFAAVGVVLGWAASCTVRFDENALFTCTADGECGGGGYICVAQKYCCRVDGDEIGKGCDGRDNDCDGMIDEGAGTLEVCNGIDDDCDGVVDNGFNLITDPANCGQCDRACMSNQACINGECVVRGEVNCIDGMDNDNDGQTDCSDTECNLLSCGAGCQCRASKKAEGNCDDTADNDGDGQIDCADADCEGAGCGTAGCICSMLAKRESDCRDTVDNDGDGQTDCADPDCAGQLCMAEPATFRCGGGGACACNDGGTVLETAAFCRDRVDNDCDGLVDCAEAGCDGESCALDGGAGCVCADLVAKETDCADRKDNDNDGFTDCGDVLPDGGGDCPVATPCTFLNMSGIVTNGTCAADRTCK